VLLPVAFWIFLGVAVLEGLLEDSIAVLVVALLSLVFGFLYQGMVVNLVRDLQDGRRDSSVKDLAASVTPVLMPLIGAGLVTAIGIVFGSLLLIVPGLYLLTIWAVTAPVVVVERKGVFGALGRSRELVRGNGWPVLGAVLVSVLIGIAASLTLTLVADGIAEGKIIDIVFYALSSMVTAPIEALVASVLYFRLLQIERGRPPGSVLEQPGDSPG
jgi:hypothetical protein